MPPRPSAARRSRPRSLAARRPSCGQSFRVRRPPLILRPGTDTLSAPPGSQPAAQPWLQMRLWGHRWRRETDSSARRAPGHGRLGDERPASILATEEAPTETHRRAQIQRSLSDLARYYAASMTLLEESAELLREEFDLDPWRSPETYVAAVCPAGRSGLRIDSALLSVTFRGNAASWATRLGSMVRSGTSARSTPHHRKTRRGVPLLVRAETWEPKRKR